MRIFRKILLYVALAFGVIVLSVTISAVLFKDRIINQFIQEANKKLNTPVKVGKMDVAVWRNFPMLSIVMKDVYVEDSHAGIYPLLTAAEASFELNLIDVWRGKYVVQGLQLTDSETNLKINSDGENNYTIAKPNPKATAGSVSFALHNVSLKNTKVNYTDHSNDQEHSYTSKDLTASIESSNDIYTIQMEGELTTNKINIEKRSYLAGKSFQIESDLIYDDAKKILQIKPSLLALKQSSFSLSGTYNWKKKNLIDIVIEGKETDIQTIISFLPESTAGPLEQYRSKGNVYFTAKLKGEISGKRSPSLNINFGCADATVYHPEYKSRVEDATITGTFESAEMLNTGSATLTLKKHQWQAQQ